MKFVIIIALLTHAQIHAQVPSREDTEAAAPVRFPFSMHHIIYSAPVFLVQPRETASSAAHRGGIYPRWNLIIEGCPDILPTASCACSCHRGYRSDLFYVSYNCMSCGNPNPGLCSNPLPPEPSDFDSVVLIRGAEPRVRIEDLSELQIYLNDWNRAGTLRAHRPSRFPDLIHRADCTLPIRTSRSSCGCQSK